eukprot:1247554-Alexandrium_andersonii.AAC.1
MNLAREHAVRRVHQDLTDEEIAKLTIFVLSYCWITADHPDPERYHLKDVARSVANFRAGCTLALGL